MKLPSGREQGLSRCPNRNRRWTSRCKICATRSQRRQAVFPSASICQRSNNKRQAERVELRGSYLDPPGRQRRRNSGAQARERPNSSWNWQLNGNEWARVSLNNGLGVRRDVGRAVGRWAPCLGSPEIESRSLIFHASTADALRQKTHLENAVLT